MQWKQQRFLTYSVTLKKIVLKNSHHEEFDLKLWLPTGTGSKENLHSGVQKDQSKRDQRRSTSHKSKIDTLQAKEKKNPIFLLPISKQGKFPALQKIIFIMENTL